MSVAARSQAMGKPSAPARIPLERAEYYELQALALKLELARQTMLSATSAYEAAQSALQEKAAGHGVQRGVAALLSFDDATYSVLVDEVRHDPA